MDIRQILADMGFEEQESIIFLYLIKKGASTQQEISDNTHILRQTVYDLMKKMLTKAYVSSSIEGKKKLYSAVPPEVILNKFREKEERFENMIPQLKEMLQPKQEIYAESFTGLEGLKNLMNLTLNSKTEILWAADQESSEGIFKDFYWDNYGRKRVENKINLKLMMEPSEKKWEKVYKTSKDWLRETKINKIMKNTECSFALFDDKIIFYSTTKEEPFGVLIKNKEIKELIAKMFLKFWKT